MAITKKIRFEVFKRDGFRCAYCGKSPPEVMLEIDHINPASKGGTDDINNLTTACFDCNRGKQAVPLNVCPSRMAENFEILKEKEAQLKAYNNLVSHIERRLMHEVLTIEQAFQSLPSTEGLCFSDSFTRSVTHFLRLLPKHEVVGAMQMAIDRLQPMSEGEIGAAMRYFCGICWRKIRESTGS